MNILPLSVSGGAAGAPESPEKTIQLIADAGFRYSELSINNARVLLERGSSRWEEFRTFAENCGIALRQGHMLNGVDLGTADEKKRREAVDSEKRCLDLFAALGITAGAVHPGCWEMLFSGVDKSITLTQLARSLAELADHSKGTPVTVCMENCPDSVPDADAAVAMLEGAGRENLGHCLDTGHLNLSRPGPGEYVRKCGEKLLALHLHDNCGMHDRPMTEQGYWYADDLHQIPGNFRGGVDWAELVKALLETGYRGLWNLEIGLGSLPNELRLMRLRHCREWCEGYFTYLVEQNKND